MKLPVRILLSLLCIAMIAAMPFVIPTPNMTDEYKGELLEEMEDGEDEFEFGRLFLSTAMAEDDLEVETLDDDGTESAPEVSDGAFNPVAQWDLPVDFSVPPEPNPACYTENSYEDESVSVRLETVEENGVTWHVAYVKIASPTQWRTAIASAKITGTKTAKVSTLAKNNHAILTFSGDNYVDNPTKTAFEYRQGQKIRAKKNSKKDNLVVDENGDFHLFLKQEGLKDYKGEIVNAYTFGPALVIDGSVQTADTDYGYNPNGREPRAAIGQTGALSYVFVIAEGRGESAGATHQELADFMAGIGCTQAFNLDGGNSAEMVFNGEIYKGQPGADERSLSDIIYICTAVPEENWK